MKGSRYLGTSLKPASQSSGMNKQIIQLLSCSFLSFSILGDDNALHIWQISKAKLFQTNLQTNSIVEILLEEPLSQLFPVAHAKGTVKCF